MNLAKKNLNQMKIIQQLYIAKTKNQLTQHFREYNGETTKISQYVTFQIFTLHHQSLLILSFLGGKSTRYQFLINN